MAKEPTLGIELISAQFCRRDRFGAVTSRTLTHPTPKEAGTVDPHRRGMRPSLQTMMRRWDGFDASMRWSNRSIADQSSARSMNRDMEWVQYLS